MKFKYSIAASAVMLALVAAAAPVSAAAEGLGVLTNDYVNSREHLDQKKPAFATILLSGDKLKKDEEDVLSIQTSGNFYETAHALKDAYINNKDEGILALIKSLRDPITGPGNSVNLTMFAGGTNFLDGKTNIVLSSANRDPINKLSNSFTSVPEDKIVGDIKLTIGSEQSEPLLFLTTAGDNVFNLGLSLFKPKQGDSNIVNVERTGDITLTALSGNIFGLTGGSLAANVNAIDSVSTDIKVLFYKVTIYSIPGETTATVDGNVLINLSGHSNALAVTTGGTAVAFGGKADSVITRDTNLLINTKADPKNNVSGFVLGVTGGGTALAAFGGNATSAVNGDSVINIDGSSVVFLTGGGLALTTKAPDFIVNKMEGDLTLSGHNISIKLKDKNQLGNATATAGNVRIGIDSAVTFAVAGGGSAIAYKPFGSEGDSNVTSTVKSTNIVLGKDVSNETLSGEEKTKLVSLIKTTTHHIYDTVKDKGLTGAVSAFLERENFDKIVGDLKQFQQFNNLSAFTLGGGLSVAFERDGSGTDQVKVKSEVEGNSSITVNKGYNFGLVGGGVALASGYGSDPIAIANIRGSSTITINGGENIGVIGGGAAAFAGSNEKFDGIASQANVGSSVIQVTGGSVDGLLGGGLALDLSGEGTNVQTNAKDVSIIAAGKDITFSYLNWTALDQQPSQMPEGPGLKGTLGQFINVASNLLDNAAKEKVAIIGGGASIGANGKTAGAFVDKVTLQLGSGVKVTGAPGKTSDTADVFIGGLASNGGYSSVGSADVTIDGAELNGNLYMGGISIGENSRTSIGDVSVKLLSGSLNGKFFTSGKTIEGGTASVGNLNLKIGSNFKFTKENSVIDASQLAKADVTFVGDREDNGLKFIDFDTVTADTSTVSNIKVVNTGGRSTTFNSGTFTLAVNDERDRGNYVVGTERTPAFVSIPELKSEMASVSVKVVNGALGITNAHEAKEHHDFVNNSKPTFYISSEDHGTIYSDIVVGNVDEANTVKLMAVAAADAPSIGTVKVGSNGQVIVNVDPSVTTVAKANWEMHPDAQLRFVKAENGSKVNLGTDVSEIQQNFTSDNQLLELKKLDEDHTHIFTLKPKSEEDQKALGIDDPDVGHFYANLPADSALKARVDSDRKINMANLKAGMNLAAAAGVQTAATDAALIALDVSSKRASLARDYTNGTEAFAEVTGITQTMGGNSSMNKIRTNLGGIAFGADRSINDWTFGALANLGAGKVKGRGDNSGVKNDVDYYGLEAYVAKRFAERFNLVGQASYTYSKNDLSDSSVGYTKANGVHAHVFSIGARAETSFALSSACRVVPYIGVNYLRVNAKGYTTSNGTKVGSTHQNMVNMPIGVAFTGKKTFENGWMVKPNIDVAYVPTFGDHNVRATTIEGSDIGSVKMDVWTKNVGRAKIGVETGKGAWRAGAFVGFAAGQNKAKEAFGQVSLRYSF
mgnify:CR=1 FL=1